MGHDSFIWDTNCARSLYESRKLAAGKTAHACVANECAVRLGDMRHKSSLKLYECRQLAAGRAVCAHACEV